MRSDGDRMQAFFLRQNKEEEEEYWIVSTLHLLHSFPYSVAARQLSHSIFRMASENNIVRGRGMNKHYWTHAEDSALVESLVELHHDSRWRADNGFRNGYLGQLETMMAAKIPGCGIKANPHVESRLKTLKTKWCALTELLSQSGFDWCDKEMTLSCEKSAYDEWVKTHKDASGLYGKPFPHFYSLGEVYGRDRATGGNVGTAADDEEEIRQEDGNIRSNGHFDVDLNEEPHSSEDLEESFSETLPSNRQQRSTRLGRVENNANGSGRTRRGKRKYMEEISGSFSMVAESIASIAPKIDGLIKVLSHDNEVDEYMEKLNRALSYIDGLSFSQKFRATDLLGLRPHLLRVFFTLPENEKKPFILRVIGDER